MKIVTLGEIMLRLTPPRMERFVQARAFEVMYGGAEANVAAALANWGEEALFVSKVPANELGQAAVFSLRSSGVDTRFVLRGGERLGVYYAERGVDRRPSKVLYDRSHSAFANSLPEEYDWDAIFSGVDVFHITGITPALSKSTEQIALMACKKAQEHGLRIFCDVNYRNKLWNKEHAAEVLQKLLRYADVCIVNESQAEELFGIAGDGAICSFAERFSCTHVAFTYRRTQDALHNKIWSTLYTGGETVCSRVYAMEMADRIGGGDAFVAGLIYAFGHGYDSQTALEFAEAASCLKHSIEGDVCLCSVEEIQALAEGGTARIGR